MNGNVNSTDCIINMSTCDARTFELFRLSTLFWFVFVCLFMAGVSWRITVSHGYGS